MLSLMIHGIMKVAIIVKKKWHFRGLCIFSAMPLYSERDPSSNIKIHRCKVYIMCRKKNPLTIVGLIWSIKIRRAGFLFKCRTVCPWVLQNQISAKIVTCAMAYESEKNKCIKEVNYPKVTLKKSRI